MKTFSIYYNQLQMNLKTKKPQERRKRLNGAQLHNLLAFSWVKQEGEIKMKITLSELLNTELISKTSKDSIMSVGKMQTKTKASVMAQLEHKFNKVEYIRGNRSNEPYFILEEPKEVKAEYKPNIGRPRVFKLERKTRVKKFKKVQTVKGNKTFTNLSRGEYAISEFLKYKDQDFLYQVRFSDCKYKYSLPFDFGIRDEEGKIKALIEYDGEQHFRTVETWGGEETLENIQKRDAIKNEYCIKKNIPLLRIKYDDQFFKLIDEFLKDV